MSTLESNKKQKTYRVRQLPAHFDTQDVVRLLSELLNCTFSVHDVTVCSLAPSNDSIETPPLLVATIKFASTPKALDSSDGSSEWLFSGKKMGYKHSIIIDIHFLGFTVLNNIASVKHEYEYNYSCIAISGLGSHPFGSWMARDGSGFMWPRDAIPGRCPGMRSIIYGYDTKLENSRSFKTIEDISKTLLEQLKSARYISPSSKPIVFLAHSLGGIILKQALVYMANGSPSDEHILSKFRKMIFFGVPNRGICQFRQLRVVSIIETAMSPIPVKTSSGKWKRNGELAVLVDPTSATHRLSKNGDDRLSIDRDHSNLVKFPEGDSDLSLVLERIEFCIAAHKDGQPDQHIARNEINDYTTPKQIRDSVLESLAKNVTQDRLETVDVALSSTFSWVFEPNTREGDAENIDAHFFFSHRGSHLQKSLDGLLHAILHRVLSESSKLADLVIAHLQLRELSSCEWDWTTEWLESAFHHVLQQKVFDVNTSLFLDALDEYEGDPPRIAKLIFSFIESTKHSKTRLNKCFSSRPWPVFRDKFEDEPSLSVQDHTHRDISSYVTSRMLGHKKAACILKIPGSRAHEFRDRLIHKADGVFLWVRLVLDKLLDELTDGATMREMDTILNNLPAGLEEFYCFILENIADPFRREAYIMLEIILRSDRQSLTAEEFWDAEQCVYSSYGTFDSIGRAESYPGSDTISGRIWSRCGGLLEVRESQDGSTTVQIMHQTVKDFLLLPGTNIAILGVSDSFSRLNGHSFLVQYALTAWMEKHKLSQGKTKIRDMSATASLLAYHANMSEQTTGLSQKVLFYEAPGFFNTVDELVKHWTKTLKLRKPIKLHDIKLSSLPIVPDKRMRFGISFDLRIFLQEYMDEQSLSAALPLVRCLVYCVWYLWYYCLPRLEVMRILLIAGANPTRPFKTFCHHKVLHKGVAPVDEDLHAVVELFCKNGADVNCEVFAKYENVQGYTHYLKPLHILTNFKMVETLSYYGADVNGVISGKGRTPLDTLFDYRASIKGKSGSIKAKKDMVPSIRLMCERGGRLSNSKVLDKAEHQLLRELPKG